jgi:hypothetical protein
MTLSNLTHLRSLFLPLLMAKHTDFAQERSLSISAEPHIVASAN